MKYLLDTNIVSALYKFPTSSVAERVAGLAVGELGTSIIVAAELRFGYVKLASPRLERLIEETLASFEIAPWESPADFAYAEIRAHLERTGKKIGQNDMLIAAHAMALDVTLVTHNMGEFSRVPGLEIENWLQD
jgi:tRNA(fMet)-specific endonuclease VapC